MSHQVAESGHAPKVYVKSSLIGRSFHREPSRPTTHCSEMPGISDTWSGRFAESGICSGHGGAGAISWQVFCLGISFQDDPELNR